MRGEKIQGRDAEGAEISAEKRSQKKSNWSRTAKDTSGVRRRLSETLRRPGLLGVCQAYPAASDLAGIYEDVGTVLITLSTSSVPSFRFSTSVSGGSAINAIRTSPGDYPFERKIFPPVSST